MGDRTKIEWTDATCATWNPVTGCSKVSSGCEHCVWLGGERVPVGKAACDMLEELHRWAVAQRRAAYEVDARRARVGEVA